MVKIYMDYNATTPILSEVKETIMETLDVYGNPSSMHKYGRMAKSIVDKARNQVADLINADPQEIIFTSCG
ncbi:aminotransferase class V-fold PLP-dependent enzyme, partial [bacterium]|nr:aminotransferase class V-fold PLP-dependent enzyme [bacterium]